MCEIINFCSLSHPVCAALLRIHHPYSSSSYVFTFSLRLNVIEKRLSQVTLYKIAAVFPLTCFYFSPEQVLLPDTDLVIETPYARVELAWNVSSMREGALSVLLVTISLM